MGRGSLTAGLVIRVTELGGHPQVGGASVEDHLEGLWRCADGDLAIVLNLCVCVCVCKREDISPSVSVKPNAKIRLQHDCVVWEVKG